MPTEVRAWRKELSAAADAEAGYSYPTYLRLRLRAVLDGFAKMIITRQEYPASSAQALFVQRVLNEWASEPGGLREDADRHRPATQAHRHPRPRPARTPDPLPHRRPQLVVQAVRRGPGEGSRSTASWTRPSRTSTARIDALNGLARLLVEHEEIRGRVDQIFGRAVLVPKVPHPLDQYVVDHTTELSELQDAGAGHDRLALWPRWPTSSTPTSSGSPRPWTPWARNELLTRHLGFAFWDIILYPIQAVSGVNERDHVEVMRFSPLESELLATADEKQLKGVTLGHFGAFFSRPGRENDYLWGRLDTAERLIVLLSTPPGRSVAWFRKPADGDAGDRASAPAVHRRLQGRCAGHRGRRSGAR